jgi:hypothetical protein
MMKTPEEQLVQISSHILSSENDGYHAGLSFNRFQQTETLNGVDFAEHTNGKVLLQEFFLSSLLDLTLAGCWDEPSSNKRVT